MDDLIATFPPENSPPENSPPEIWSEYYDSPEFSPEFSPSGLQHRLLPPDGIWPNDKWPETLHVEMLPRMHSLPGDLSGLVACQPPAGLRGHRTRCF